MQQMFVCLAHECSSRVSFKSFDLWRCVSVLRWSSSVDRTLECSDWLCNRFQHDLPVPVTFHRCVFSPSWRLASWRERTWRWCWRTDSKPTAISTGSTRVSRLVWRTLRSEIHEAVSQSITCPSLVDAQPLSVRTYALFQRQQWRKHLMGDDYGSTCAPRY